MVRDPKSKSVVDAFSTAILVQALQERLEEIQNDLEEERTARQAMQAQLFDVLNGITLQLPPPILSITQTAVLLNCNEVTVRSALNRGDLKEVRIGARRLVDARSIKSVDHQEVLKALQKTVNAD